MYLSHFGFSEQPFTHISDANLFCEGANRGEVLDALIYMLTHGEGVEGIIKVTGEDGSGKTTLCRLLGSRLPLNIKTIYLAKPDLSPEDPLKSTANELKLDLAVSRATAAYIPTAICDLKNALEKHAMSVQVVLLIDEAHTIAAETLEELRLLYDLASFRHKLLQIVLFGRSELENVLVLPQMRQFRERVTQHFTLQPFNAKATKEYLRCHMCAAGYGGPDIFTPEAVRLIAMASGGIAQRINILANRSLMSAFAVNTRNIDARQVKAVIKNAGIKRGFVGLDWPALVSHRVTSATAIFAVLMLCVLGWRSIQMNVTPPVAALPVDVTASAPVSAPLYPPRAATVMPGAPPPASASPSGTTAPISPPEHAAGTISAQGKLATTTEQAGTVMMDVGGVKLADHKLVGQRVEATKQIMATVDKNYYSIQLFVTDNIQPDRMERFLIRAQSLVKLSDLYMHPVNNEGQAHFRVFYGIYPTRDQASVAMDELPQKYKTAFSPELYTLADLR